MYELYPISFQHLVFSSSGSLDRSRSLNSGELVDTRGGMLTTCKPVERGSVILRRLRFARNLGRLWKRADRLFLTPIVDVVSKTIGASRDVQDSSVLTLRENFAAIGRDVELLVEK
ncbi:hypothetical protein QAD02_001662 [Eretmocerus hayati]|uniref:Uncharacterized protein n=1 Tax=Eretmocerus hayati TaxID=131215 RepID=A0ACC2NGT8_9HYME|nr:hypothetical protein QAD02_001662 [Eretmocerus hayati]